jgi:hypothetical protein
MSLTPAMTLFDVDGSLPRRARRSRARRRGARDPAHGIAGSIGIDLPPCRRADAQAAAAALDAVLPQPFERTAVNGFGFLQIVRRRETASLAEIVQAIRRRRRARLLRRAQRLGAIGGMAFTRAGASCRIEASPTGWRARAAAGGAVACRPSPASPYRRACPAPRN